MPLGRFVQHYIGTLRAAQGSNAGGMDEPRNACRQRCIDDIAGTTNVDAKHLCTVTPTTRAQVCSRVVYMGDALQGGHECFRGCHIADGMLYLMGRVAEQVERRGGAAQDTHIGSLGQELAHNL